MILNFDTSMAKVLKVIVRKFFWLICTFVEGAVERLAEVFLHPPLPEVFLHPPLPSPPPPPIPPPFLNKVNIKILKKFSQYKDLLPLFYCP